MNIRLRISDSGAALTSDSFQARAHTMYTTTGCDAAGRAATCPTQLTPQRMWRTMSDKVQTMSDVPTACRMFTRYLIEDWLGCVHSKRPSFSWKMSPSPFCSIIIFHYSHPLSERSFSQLYLFNDTLEITRQRRESPILAAMTQKKALQNGEQKLTSERILLLHQIF